MRFNPHAAPVAAQAFVTMLRFSELREFSPPDDSISHVLRADRIMAYCAADTRSSGRIAARVRGASAIRGLSPV
jgi:hypothetical protein